MGNIDTIVVLDFGGQYAHLIANRVRRLGVYSEVLAGDTSASALQKNKTIRGIILSGGPQSVNEKNSPTCDPALFELRLPVLGVCYGHQLMGHVLGGIVSGGGAGEYGKAFLEVKKAEGIFEGFETGRTQIWMSHFDTVTALPDGFEVIGSTPDCEMAAIANFKKRFFGTQFHVEVAHTTKGMDILDNFLKICGANRTWDLNIFLNDEIERVKAQVGNRNVFMLVSGGVDSTVAFVLLEKALGANRIYGLFVDTGFMRKNERENVEKALSGAGFKLHVEDASSQFFAALKGVTDPERKREIIGSEFLKVHARVALQLKLDAEYWMLGQGTIYPDTIESGGTKNADKIKTHHNRVPEIEALIEKGLVVEPLKELYKDEVRVVGEKLGLSTELVWRHPFPGPGLAVRCLCASGPDELPDHGGVEAKINESLAETFGKASNETFNKASNEAFNDASGNAGMASPLIGKILPIKSVGVQGDARSYRHPLVIWHTSVPGNMRSATKSLQGQPLSSLAADIAGSKLSLSGQELPITENNGKSTPPGRSDATINNENCQLPSSVARLPLLSWSSLETISTNLTNHFKAINRVLYLCSPEKITSVEIVHSDLSPERINYLQHADAIVTKFLHDNNLMKEMWQFPVVLLPVRINGEEGEAIVLRPVNSTEAMTANFYQMDQQKLLDLTHKLLVGLFPAPSAVLYDITNKPPGTIEWE